MRSFLDKSVVSTKFIGREPQLAALEYWLTPRSQGASQVVLVAGEAGIGKSRFVSEACQRAAQQGWRTVQGSCFEPDLVFPYAPLIDLLRTYLARRPADEVTALLGPRAAELVKLLPELALTMPDLTPTPPLDPESEKRRLFETLVQFFDNLMSPEPGAAQDATASRVPLLIVIEDLHWSDETSLEFLRYLARRLSHQPLLLLLTYRSDEIQPTLQHFLAAMSREQRPTELVLARFAPPEVDALLRTIFEQEQPVRTEFLDALMNLTGGNPFFIEEVLKALIATGDLFYQDGAWDRKPIDQLRIPHSIQDAVQRRVAQLSEDAHRTLRVAAVAGRHFDFGVLQAVTTCSEAALLRQIKELLAAQLVVELSAERFAFRHALTQKTIYDELLVRERQALHLQIGEAFEAQSAGDAGAPAASLAHHFYAAGEWKKAFRYARRAGKEAQALFTPRAAVEHFSHALEAAHHLGATAPMAGLHRERGLAHEVVGDFAAARADLETALHMARAAENHPLEWQILIDLGKLWASRDYEQTGRYYQAAVELARDQDDPSTLARSLNRLGNWHLNQEQSAQAIQYHLEALTIFERQADRHGQAATFDLLGMTYYLGGEFEQGAVYCRRAIQFARTLNNRQALSTSLSTLAICGTEPEIDVFLPINMDLAERNRYSEESVRIAREIGWRAGEAFALCVVGDIMKAQGKYEDAIATLRRALTIAQEIEHHQWMSLVHRFLGCVYIDLRMAFLAQPQMEEALRIATEIGSTFQVRAAQGHLIAIYVLQHDLAKAQEFAQRVLPPDLPMRTIVERQLWQGRAELALAQGDAALALGIAERLFDTATGSNGVEIGAIPYLALVQGSALTALERWHEAESALLAALGTAKSRKALRLIWRIHAALGRLAQAREQHQGAARYFAAARASVNDIAATLHDAELRDTFVQNALAEFTPQPASTPLQAAKQAYDGLTRRERQVAALIAQGKSNREIAETLVLAVRTVEGHVSNILGKLGFTSRTEIAVWAVEKGLLAQN